MSAFNALVVALELGSVWAPCRRGASCGTKYEVLYSQAPASSYYLSSTTGCNQLSWLFSQMLQHNSNARSGHLDVLATLTDAAVNVSTSGINQQGLLATSMEAAKAVVTAVFFFMIMCMLTILRINTTHRLTCECHNWRRSASRWPCR